MCLRSVPIGTYCTNTSRKQTFLITGLDHPRGSLQLEPGIGGPHRGWDLPARGNTGVNALGLFRAARDPTSRYSPRRLYGAPLDAVPHEKVTRNRLQTPDSCERLRLPRQEPTFT